MMKLLWLVLPALVLGDEFPYRKPPQKMLAVLNAPLTPVASLSPARDVVLLMQPVRYPPIAEVAQPVARLAGIRIDIESNGMHRTTNYSSFTIQPVDGGAAIKVVMPSGAKLGTPAWSPDGRQFAFTNTTPHGIELWIGEEHSGKTRRLEGVRVNGVQIGIGGREAVEWMSDGHTLLVRLIPEGRGAAPPEPKLPSGPDVQESLGHAGPAPTYEDLLATPHDEDLFDYYATSQLAWVDAASGKASPIGKPAIYLSAMASPDAKHVLTVRLHRPYSYQLPATRFPEEIEIWDAKGNLEHKIASLALADRVALGAARPGPRAFEWLPDHNATLVWVEGSRGRDKIMMFAEPFGGEARQVYLTEHAFRGFQALAGGKALVEDYERNKRMVRTILIDTEKHGEGKVIFSRNQRDAYKDPGTPVTKMLANGQRAVIQQGDEIYLRGQGASPEGDKPFLDRYNLKTGKAERLFQSSHGYEAVEAMLDDRGERLLLRRESPTEPPGYFVRSAEGMKALTNFPNPTPQTLGIKKQLVTYKRKDGVPLSFTLYLPPDYKVGKRLPALV